jgi:general secretion pathway protein D
MLAGLLVLLPAVPLQAQTAPPASGTAAAAPTPAAPESRAPETTAPPAVPVITPEQMQKARSAFVKGTAALKANQPKRAMQWFHKAHQLDPSNGAYLAAFEIARQQRIGDMIHAARKEKSAGQQNAARDSLMAAMSLDPGNPYVQQEVNALTPAGTLSTADTAPMPKLARGSAAELAPAPVRATFHLRGSPQQLIPQIFSAYGITPILDDSVPAKPVQIDLTNAPFSEASAAVQLATDTFVVPLDPEHAVVAEDTKDNRDKFERLLLETIYVPGLPAKELTEPVNMIRNVFGVKQIATRPGSGTITLRAPETTLRAVNATLESLYRQKPDVILDVKVYQIDDSRQEDLGVAFPQTLSVFNVTSQLNSIISSNQSTIQQLIASGLVNPNDLIGIAALLVGEGLVTGTVLNQPFALFGNGLTLSGLSFGSTTANASLNIANTHELDHIQLRTGPGQKQTFLLGSKYPVVTQSYSAGTQTPTNFSNITSLLTGSTQSNLSSANPLSYAPTVQYVNLGLTLTALTRIVDNGNVQMQLKVKLASLSGQNVNGSPIIDNRSFTTAIQVHDGGSAMIASSISQTESRSLTGIPGLSELPGFQWTASPSTQLTIGRLLIVLTPHVVGLPAREVASRQIPLGVHADLQ